MLINFSRSQFWKDIELLAWPESQMPLSSSAWLITEPRPFRSGWDWGILQLPWRLKGATRAAITLNAWPTIKGVLLVIGNHSPVLGLMISWWSAHHDYMPRAPFARSLLMKWASPALLLCSSRGPAEEASSTDLGELGREVTQPQRPTKSLRHTSVPYLVSLESKMFSRYTMSSVQKDSPAHTHTSIVSFFLNEKNNKDRQGSGVEWLWNRRKLVLVLALPLRKPLKLWAPMCPPT